LIVYLLVFIIPLGRYFPLFLLFYRLYFFFSFLTFIIGALCLCLLPVVVSIISLSLLFCFL